MRKLSNILEIKLVNDCKDRMDNKFHSIFTKIILSKINTEKYSKSSKLRRIEALFDIIMSNSNSNIEELFDEYFKCNEKRRIEIRYGKEKLIEYENKLKKTKSRPNFISQFNKQYWINKGYSESDAIKKITEIQKNNSLKNKNRKKSKKEKIKHSIHYWLNKGYSIEESELLRLPYLAKMKNGLHDLINRYGEIEGQIKHQKRIQKYKDSMNSIISTKKSSGYVSKESLKFFLPLYKHCRKLGFKRNEIYFGISGSREFFIKDMNIKNTNCGAFFDFCIPKIKLIVEYNGTFWHPRNVEDWRNPWIDYNYAMERETYKKNLIKSRNFELIEVWSDDNMQEQLNMILEKIKCNLKMN